MITRNLATARAAYAGGDPAASRRAHEQAVERHQQAHGQYVKSIIYGGLDGSITTFAVVAGVEGASLSMGIVLILGMANLIADGLSMAIGDYLSTRSEQEYACAERAREQWEVEHYPDGERRELEELYMAKGMDAADARTVVGLIAKNKKVWVDVMMVEELGIVQNEESPLKNALATFTAFALFGAVPLVTPLAAILFPALRGSTFWSSCVLTALTLFALGALKTRVTMRPWLRSGLEMLGVGGVAAAAAYAIGYGLSRLQ